MNKQNTEAKGLLFVLLLPAIYPILAILFNLSDSEMIELLMANQVTVISGAALLLITVVAVCCLGTVTMVSQPRHDW